MKYTLTLLSLVISLFSFGQTVDPSKLIINGGYGYQYKIWKVDSALVIPSKADTTSKVPAQIKLLGNSLYFTGTDGIWRSASSSGETTSGNLTQLRAMTSTTGKLYTLIGTNSILVDIGLNDGAYTDDGNNYIITNNNHVLAKKPDQILPITISSYFDNGGTVKTTQALRTGSVISGLIDPNTGENVSYTVVTTKPNGRPYTMLDVDGTIITYKTGIGYALRNFTGLMNVKWFGAKGDGSTNDAAAINAAIDLGKRFRDSSIFIYRGNTIGVFFPKGKYNILSPIFGKVAVDLVGSAKNDAIIVQNDKSIGGIIFNETTIPDSLNITYTNISNLSIIGGSFTENPFAYKNTSINYAGANGVELHNHRINISNCTIAGWNESGITSSSVYYVYVNNSLIMNNKVGMHITNVSTSNFVTNSEIRLNGIAFIIDGGSFANFISSSTIESNIANFLDPEPLDGGLVSSGKAFILSGSTRTNVYGNYIENHTSTFALQNTSDNHIFSNFVVPAPTNTTTDGITDLVTYYNASVRDNRFENNSFEFGDTSKKANIRILNAAGDYSSDYYSFTGTNFDKIIRNNLAKWKTQFSGIETNAPIIANIARGQTYRALVPNLPAVGGNLSTVGYLPIVTSSNTLGQSRLYQDNIGQLGIGTTVPIVSIQARPGTDVNLGFIKSGASLVLNAFDDTGGANIPVQFRGSSFDFAVGPTSVLAGTAPNHAVNKGQLDAKTASANANATSADATDLPSALTLINELKTVINLLQDKLRAATLLTNP